MAAFSSSRASSWFRSTLPREERHKCRARAERQWRFDPRSRVRSDARVLGARGDSMVSIHAPA